MKMMKKTVSKGTVDKVEDVKKEKVNPLELLSEYFSIQKSIKRLEESAASLKSSIMGLPEKYWKTSSTGSRFLWSEDEKQGVQLIQPEAKMVLDREAAIRYCEKHKLATCLKHTLDDDGFSEACEEGSVPENALRSLMVESSPAKAHIRSISKIPSEGDNG